MQVRSFLKGTGVLGACAKLQVSGNKVCFISERVVVNVIEICWPWISFDQLDFRRWLLLDGLDGFLEKIAENQGESDKYLRPNKREKEYICMEEICFSGSLESARPEKAVSRSSSRQSSFVSFTRNWEKSKSFSIAENKVLGNLILKNLVKDSWMSHVLY